MDKDRVLGEENTKAQNNQTLPADPQGYAQYDHYELRKCAPSREERSSKKSFGHRFFTTAFFAIMFGVLSALTFQVTNRLLDRSWGRVNRSLNWKEASRTALPQTELLTVEEGDESVTVSTRKQQGDNSTVKREGRTEDSASQVVLSKGTVAGVAEAVMPSVVAITTVSIQEMVSFWGRYQNYTSTGTGSGIIVGENDEELLIATNYHVVEDASTLSVCFIGDDVVSAKKEISRAARGGSGLNLTGAVSGTVKGADEVNDLAVVAVKKADIPEETMNKLKIATLGSSDDLVVGEQVVAIGNALGYGQTVTSGWLSALDRTVTLSNGHSVQLLQTDAAINPGNSGGALLNMRGEVIGINCARYNSSTVEGTGYAIPVSTAQPILEELMRKETREKVTDVSKMATLDIEVADLAGSVQWMYGVPEGAFVTSVVSDGLSEAAGLTTGDVILRFDGTRVYDSEDLIELLEYYEAGETVSVMVSRSSYGYYDYEETIKVELSNRYQGGSES